MENLLLQLAFGNERLAQPTHIQNALPRADDGLLQVGHELQAAVEVCVDGRALAQAADGRAQQGEDVEGHLGRVEGDAAVLLDGGCHHVVPAHQAGAAGPADDGAAHCEVIAPVLAVEAVEQRLEAELGLGVQAVAAEGAVVGRQRQHHRRRLRVEPARLLLLLDLAQHAQHVDQHDAVRQLRLAVDAVHLLARLADGREGHHEVQVAAVAGLVVDV